MHELIIVGGGPAGLTAAVFAVNQRMDAVLIGDELGGKSSRRMQFEGMAGLERVAGEADMRRFKDQLRHLDCAWLRRRAQGLERGVGSGVSFVVTDDRGDSHETRTVVLATGSRPVPAGCPGERELLGRGVSYAARIHAPLFWGRDVVVAGGGMAALVATADLGALAGHVYLIAGEGPPVDTPLYGVVRGLANVTVMSGCVLMAICGDGNVTEVVVREADGNSRVLPVHGAFIEQGSTPSSSIVAGLCDLDRDGSVLVDAGQATSVPGIWAAGDVTSCWPGPMLAAMGDGAKAALAVYKHLAERHESTMVAPAR